MKGKSISRRIEELNKRLHPRNPVDDLSEAEVKELAKTCVLDLLGISQAGGANPSTTLRVFDRVSDEKRAFDSPFDYAQDLRRREDSEQRLEENGEIEQSRKKHERFIEEFLDCGRSGGSFDETHELWEALWELEKKFARKEDRRMNFGINVLLVDRADDEYFKKLRAYCRILPLSSEHRKAVQELISK